MSTPPDTPSFAYDVFISYSSRDAAWVRGELLPRLKSHGYRVCIDFECFEIGAPSVKEMERAVLTSRKTLLVLTPNYLASDWTEFETLMLHTLDPVNRELRMLPLLKESCTIPTRLRPFTYIDFTDPHNQEFAWGRLVGALGPPADDSDAELQAEDALNRLLDLGLLETEDEDSLRLHRLLAAFARAVVTDAEAQTAAEQTMRDVAAYFNSKGDPRPLLVLQPHLRFVTNAAMQREDELAARLCSALDYHLDAVGDYTGARAYSERALSIRERMLGGGEHPDTAGSLNNLGSVLQAQGDLAGARDYYERALAILEQRLSPDHPNTQIVRDNLATLDEQPQTAEQQIAEIEQRAQAAVEQELAEGSADERGALVAEIEEVAQWAENGEAEGSPWLALAARLRALAARLGDG